MLKSLLWKEWRECRWILLGWSLTFVLGVLAARYFDLWLLAIALLPAAMIAIIVAAVKTTGSYQPNADDLLASFPMRQTLIAPIKLASGIVTFAVPLALGLLITIPPWAGGDSSRYEMGNGFRFFNLVSSAVIIYLWIVVIAGRRRHPGTIAFTGIAVLVSEFIAGIVLAILLMVTATAGPHALWQVVAAAGFGLIPPLYLPFLRLEDFIGVSTSSQVIPRTTAMALLGLWAVIRLRPERRLHAAPRTTGHQAKRTSAKSHRSILDALVWKTFREVGGITIVIVAIDLALTFGLAVLSVALQKKSAEATQGPATWVIGTTIVKDRMPTLGELITYMMPFISFEALVLWAVIGIVLMIGLAIQLTCNDRRPGLDEFWRSRPIPGLGLFCIKYAAGICVIAVVTGTAWCVARVLCNYGILGTPDLMYLLPVCVFHLCLFNVALSAGSLFRSGIVIASLSALLIPFLLLALEMESPPAQILMAAFSMLLPMLSASRWRSSSTARTTWLTMFRGKTRVSILTR